MEMRAINLPAELCTGVEKAFGGKLGSLEEFLEFVLREILRDEAVQSDERERNLVEQRLRELGYL